MALGLAVAGATEAQAKPGAVKSLGGTKPWPALRGMAAVRGKLYVASAVTVLAVDKTGKTTDLYRGDTGVGAVAAMTTLNDTLYVIAGRKLYAADKRGGFKEVGDDYRRPAAMVGLADKLYILDDGALWQVSPNGDYHKLKGDWYHIGGMATLAGKLYVVRNTGELDEVATTGEKKQLAGSFEGAVAMTAAADKLYIVTVRRDQAVLHVVDASGQSSVLLPDGFGKDATAVVSLAALEGTLYGLVAAGDEAKLFAVEIK